MKIVVLAGGTSSERDVSLCSGGQIHKALCQNGHEAILLDVYLGYEADESKLDDLFKNKSDCTGNYAGITAENPDIEAIKALRKDDKKSFFGPNVIKLCQMADVVFMGLHGENGENGKIQACFELMGIKYTGTDCVSSAMSMDKAITKDIFYANGIPTPKGIHVKKELYTDGFDNSVPFPLIVKACKGGSSIGVSIAKEEKDFHKAMDEAFKYDDEVIVEQFIEGREFSIGVMDGKAMPIIEIAPIEGFYDYKNKYQAGSTIETCPAELDDEMTVRMQQCAEKAFEALRLKNYARFDFMLDAKSNTFYCLEANTLPGMTPTSLVPQEAAALGISFGELCEKIISLSL